MIMIIMSMIMISYIYCSIEKKMYMKITDSYAFSINLLHMYTKCVAKL